ncbi:hypothetical protein [Pseudonocardia sp. SID8383]|uniref:hypothetical protein n=1 Tax=Pseudonocardia sp. SID8383 TaxID=2690363 RepID=UPI00136E7198|nr:hypothetical protein [Pseudonocardia sp. SID8383]MYW71918.1 hypothetical protein [Pseudonocardia sp. SID8383]
MVQQAPPSDWAVAQFGDSASDVARHVVVGLIRGQRSARVVQEVASNEGAGDKRAYGSMWAARYKIVVDQFELADLPSYQVIRPKGASYSLAVVSGRVLIPFRHATSLKVPISRAKLDAKVPRAVSRENGVAPALSLFEVEGAETDLTVAEAAAAAHRQNLTVVYVGYVSNADSDDILAAWWGTPMSLEVDGTMNWNPEPIDVAVAATEAAKPGGPQVVGGGVSGAGFTQGELPPLTVTARTATVELPSAELEERDDVAEAGDE